MPGKDGDDGRDDPGPPAGPHHRPQPAGVRQDEGGHGAEGALARADEVGGAGGQPIDVGLARRREVVHLVVQQHACKNASRIESAHEVSRHTFRTGSLSNPSKLKTETGGGVIVFFVRSIFELCHAHPPQDSYPKYQHSLAVGCLWPTILLVTMIPSGCLGTCPQS